MGSAQHCAEAQCPSGQCSAEPTLRRGNTTRTPVIFDRMKLVLFDIDGTLLWTDGAGRRAIHRALLEETGTAGPIETYRFDGKTDPQIVRELLALAGHPDATDEQRIEAVCRRYVGLLSAELAKPAQATRLMVGIAQLLLADRKSTRLNSSHSQISYAVFCLKKKTSLSPSAPLT